MDLLLHDHLRVDRKGVSPVAPGNNNGNDDNYRATSRWGPPVDTRGRAGQLSRSPL